jgi:hypothetical protein
MHSRCETFDILKQSMHMQQTWSCWEVNVYGASLALCCIQPEREAFMKRWRMLALKAACVTFVALLEAVLMGLVGQSSMVAQRPDCRGHSEIIFISH